MSQHPDQPHTSTSLPCRADDGILPHPPRAAAPRRSHWPPTLLLLGALLALGWWFQQRTSALSSQLVATQDSFALISEQASAERDQMADRLDDSHLQSSDRQASLRLQQLELEGRLDELRQQLATLAQLQASQQAQQQQLDALQASLGEHASQFNDQLQQLEATSQQQLTALQDMPAQQQALGQRLDTLEQRADPLPQLAAMETRLGELDGHLQQLAERLAEGEAGREQLLGRLDSLQQGLENLQQQQQRQASIEALQRLQDELLVLRSTLEKLPPPGISRREFDSYRQQTTRHITTLQTQLRNLQNRR